MLSVGLTGNFGMGKSTVLSVFRKLGAHTYDVDKFVKEILSTPHVIRKIVKVLGTDITEKRSGKVVLKRQTIADIIFSSQEKRKDIEKIIHPEVLKKIKNTFVRLSKSEPDALIVFEVPLLFEAGYEKFFDKTVAVSCNRKKAVERLIRKGYSEDEACRRLRAQMPVSMKKKMADFRINNSGTPGKTAEQVRRIFSKLTGE